MCGILGIYCVSLLFFNQVIRSELLLLDLSCQNSYKKAIFFYTSFVRFMLWSEKEKYERENILDYMERMIHSPQSIYSSVRFLSSARHSPSFPYPHDGEMFFWWRGRNSTPADHRDCSQSSVWYKKRDDTASSTAASTLPLLNDVIGSLSLTSWSRSRRRCCPLGLLSSDAREAPLRKRVADLISLYPRAIWG